MLEACAAPVAFRQRVQWQWANFENGGCTSYLTAPHRQPPRSAPFEVVIVFLHSIEAQPSRQHRDKTVMDASYRSYSARRCTFMLEPGVQETGIATYEYAEQSGVLTNGAVSCCNSSVLA